MTLEEIEGLVAEIGRLGQYDDEGAHAKEDRLWHDVLQVIADGAESPAELAAAALKTMGLEFSRWYA